ncbi:hypothetical protein ACWIEX_05980 [Bosea sp. NPDC055353]
MTYPIILPPAAWPAESEILSFVAKRGEVVILQYKDRASGEWLRMHFNYYDILKSQMPYAIGNFADHVICLIFQASPLKFVLLKWTADGPQVAQPYQFSRDDIEQMAIRELWKAKKDHSTSTLAKRAWKEASLELRASMDKEEFMYRFGGVMKSFRDPKNPYRPLFLNWWIDHRGPPDNLRETYIYELPKAMTVKEYNDFMKERCN